MKSNLKSFGDILKQEGTSRYERYLPALHPESFSMDDRRLEDFIVYAQRYARNLLFVDTEAENPDLSENWEYFFKTDIVMLIAEIATRNVKEIKANYDFLSARFLADRNLDNFIELAEYAFSAFKKLSGWYYSSTAGSPLNNDLRLYIRSYLQRELETLKEILLYTRNQTGNNYRTEDFKKELFRLAQLEDVATLLRRDDVWELKDRENISFREHIFGGNNDVEKLSAASLVLNKSFDAVFHATEAIVNNCQGYFEDTIRKKQDHSPHVALFITFLKLFGFVQDELNKIPRRHLDFYYKEVLRIKTKEAIPDEAFVVFELAKGFNTYEVKKGTRLAAGKDRQSKDLVYETEEDFVVNKAQVASLQTVFIDKDKDHQTINYYAESIQPLTAGDGKRPLPDNPSWKIFGEAIVDAVTEIGFGISSTQFYLEKGERTVVITFELQENIAFTDFDTSLLKLLLTGEKGWLSSDKPSSGITIGSLKKAGQQNIELRFSISITQPSAIVAFKPAIHEGNFLTASPVLQCILKYPPACTPEEQASPIWQNKIAQLNTLQKVRITRTSIRVQVGSLLPGPDFDGVKDLLVQNNESVLDSKKPFYPFTAVPRVGATFYIGCNDLFYKSIQNLSLNIEWALPDNFDSYYGKYLPPYDSNKFTASLSILRNSHWVKLGNVSIIDVDTPDPKFRSLKIDFGKINLDELSAQEKAISTYDHEKKDGTLMLSLNHPDFGHAVYPQLITSAVMEKASSKSAVIDYYQIVKKHLRDSVISIKLPDDIDNRTGSLKVVYDILNNINSVKDPHAMLIHGLSELLRRYNGSEIITRKGKIAVQDNSSRENDGRKIVNDDNYIDRLLGFLKKVKLVDRPVHYDEDKQDAEQVVDAVKEDLNLKADFIMPPDKELVAVIMNETNSAINKTVANVTDEILAERLKGNPEPSFIAALLNKEFGEANEVINDMIARKIALLLSTNEIPSPPYTPLINAISLSYSSVKDSTENTDRYFHITPFGVLEIDLSASESRGTNTSGNNRVVTRSIFPKSIVMNQETPVEMQGMLFIGVKDLSPDQNLSLLVQMAEGSKLNDKKPTAITWWYLHDYDWMSLKEDYLVSDSTYGFQTTGIVEISIPKDANNTSNLFNTPSQYWFCASVARETDAFPSLVTITAQATWAVFRNEDNDPGHLELPLEAKKINSLVDKVPQVKTVLQPVSSFNGKVGERPQEFYTRVSERLRHKARAINSWDYERLVLDNFPALFKVKCINNYFAGHFATGHVTVVPIADLRNRNYKGNNLLIPKTSYIDLLQIEEFLSGRCSPFIRVHAINPQLDHVFIRCKVKFHTGVDKGYYLQQLNQDLVDFLTPWAAGKSEALSFSAKIYASSIVNFIDRRDYVDYVTDLIMQQYSENEAGEKTFVVEADQLSSLEETRITTGHSILVSAPSHEIELVE